MEIGIEESGLTATGGDPAATPALHLLDAISMTEAETHFQNAKIVEAQNTQEPTNGRQQPFAEIVPVVVHLPASARAYRSGNRPQEYFDSVTVSQSSPGPQAGVAAHPAG